MFKKLVCLNVALIALALVGAHFWPQPAQAMSRPDDGALEIDAGSRDATDDSGTDDSDNPVHATQPKRGRVPPKAAMKEADKNSSETEAPALPAGKSGSWWHPHPGTSWQIQYAGKLDTSFDVNAYDIDLVDTDESVIQALHGRGIKVICYFNAGSYEKWRSDAGRFPASILGKSNGWKDERWLDIRRIDILKPIMAARINLAARKGCDAVDPDNVDGYSNKSGFPLTAANQIAYNTMIADLAHADGLAVGLKNDLDQIGDLIGHFDFAVNEQCFKIGECEELTSFVNQKKPVFNIEYNIPTSQFCSQAKRMHFDSLKKKLDLNADVEFCR